MRALRGLLVGLISAAIGPAYLGLLSCAARVGPWPRTLARPAAFLVAALALAWFGVSLAGFLFRPGGWAESSLRVPAAAARQLRRAALVLVVAGLVFLLPERLLARGLIAPEGRVVPAPAVCR